ncbi:MAG: hypothetical protein IH957_08680 [Chloroflexi bacterium]|nr:hypothetical protein [Chloroflexota bacterium]
MRKIVFAASIIALVVAVFALALWAAPSGPAGTSAEHYPCDPPPSDDDTLAGPMPQTYTNTTHTAASDLCVVYTGLGGLGNLQVTVNAPGCPMPNVANAGDLRVFIDWGVDCVQPGDSVQVSVGLPGSLVVQEEIWTFNGDPITPPPEETETPTETPVEETTTPEPTPVETVEATPTPTEETPTPHPTKNPIDDDWPDLTAAEEKAVKDLADAGKKADALANLVETMKKYCCSFGTMDGGAPVYDSTLDGEGSTERKKGGVVEIGDDAFTSVA